jgi:hypothetical protein
VQWAKQERPFLGNGSVNTPTTIEDLLKAVFSVGSAPRLYKGDPGPAERIKYKRLKLGGGEAYDRSSD